MKQKNSKGFVLSLDAMVALLILFSMFVIATAYFAGAGHGYEKSLSLKETAMDSLSVLEKNGKLENSARTENPAELRSFLNMLPSSLCAEIRVYRQSDLNNSFMSVLKEGCTTNFSSFESIRRSFVSRNGSNADFFVAEMLAWQKVSQ